jgi:CelD/BcsL family acetyltransferase involved in cellulose biosynthesis/RimJ/RimL family protein N-acetyltransferase
MTIDVTRGDEALQQLSDGRFQEAWAALHRACPWAAPAQSAGFATTWYKVYGDRFSPVLVSGYDADGTLSGLLTLAVPKTGSGLIVAGDPQGEYKVWIASPDSADSFIREALVSVRRQFPHQDLRFTYLPPNTPLDCFTKDKILARCCKLRLYRRPLLLIDPLRLAESFRKKANKRRIAQLNRLGDVRFERVLDAGRASSLLDEISTWYDLRMGALYDVLPFQGDPQKKAFNIALLEETDILYFTALTVDGVVVSAHLGLHDSHSVQGGVFAHSPWYAKLSPGKLQVMMLQSELIRDGVSVLDLTPGGDAWKERFANSHDQVFQLTMYGRVWTKWTAGMTAGIRAFVKRCMTALGVSPNAVRALTTARQLGVRGITGRLERTVQKRMRHETFRFDIEGNDQDEPADTVSRDSLKDLLAFEHAEPWQNRRDFLSTALRRAESGHHSYTRVEGDRLAHYGWLIEHPEEALSSDLVRGPRPPDGSALIVDCYTHPEARGKGLFQASVRQMLRDARAIPGCKHVYASVPSKARQASHALEKLHFVRV